MENNKENNKEPEIGSVEYYEQQLNQAIAKSKRLTEILEPLIMGNSSLWPTVVAGPKDGLADVSDILKKLGETGTDISYYRGKILDRTLYR